MDADQGVAVAAFVRERQRELERRAAVALGDDARAAAQQRPAAPRRAPVPAPAACRYGGSRKTRSYASPRARCVAEGRAGGARPRAAPPPARARASRGWRAMTADRAPVALDEHGPRRPARERLDGERARAGEQVEHARAVERAEHREQRLAHAVGGRPRGAAARRPQAPAAEAPGDDPHAATGSASTSASASASSACSGAASAGSARSSAAARAWARSSSARVVGQAREAKAREARLARARQLALAAQLEVDLGQREAVGVLGQRAQARRVRAARRAGTARGASPRPTRPRSWCSCEMP